VATADPLKSLRHTVHHALRTCARPVDVQRIWSLLLVPAILSELKSRGVIRTENPPVGDYAEYLVATAFGRQLAPNSEKSWDVLSNDGEKLQVIALVVPEPAEPGRMLLASAPAAGALQGSARKSNVDKRNNLDYELKVAYSRA